MKAYIVHSWWGEYSDRGEAIEGVFAKRQSAVEWIKAQTVIVYEDNGEWYAGMDFFDSDKREIHPTRHREWWEFDCHYDILTKTYEILEFEVVEG